MAAAENKFDDLRDSSPMTSSRAMFSDVVFHNVQEIYAVDSPLVVQFSVNIENLRPSADDLIGLFRIGWLSVRDHILSAKMDCVEQDLNSPGMKTVTFNVADVKLEDGEFYQLCYVVASGQVRGVSTPFQFIANDFEIVSDNMDSTSFVHKETDSFERAMPDVETSNYVKAMEDLSMVMTSGEVQVEMTSQTETEPRPTLSFLEDALCQAKSEIMKYQEENSELQTRLAHTMENSRKENALLISELDDLKTKLAEKNESNLNLMKEITEVKSQLSVEQRATCQLDMSLTALKEAQEMIKERCNKLKHQNCQLEKERSKLTKEMQELVDRNRELVETVEQLRQMVERAKEPMAACEELAPANTMTSCDVGTDSETCSSECVPLSSQSSQCATFVNEPHNYIPFGGVVTDQVFSPSSFPPGHPSPSNHPMPPYVPQVPMYPYSVAPTWFANPYANYIPEAYRGTTHMPNYY